MHNKTPNKRFLLNVFYRQGEENVMMGVNVAVRKDRDQIALDAKIFYCTERKTTMR